MESLFTSIPVEETINYIINRIYVQKEIKHLCKKSIFKKPWLKLTKNLAFSPNGNLLKQIDDWSMGGLLPVVFIDIYMCEMEIDVVVPAKPSLYKRYVDDTYVPRKKNIRDIRY